MSADEFTRLLAGVNSGSSLISDLDFALLIEKLADVEYNAIVKAKEKSVEFVGLDTLKREILRKIENSETRSVVDLMSTTLFINKTVTKPDIMFTCQWFSHYDKMVKMDLEEDIVPFVIENLEQLRNVLCWAMYKWVEILKQSCLVESEHDDFMVYELVEIASIVDMYHELRVDFPDEFNVNTDEVRDLFTKTIHNLLFNGKRRNIKTIEYFHTHKIFTEPHFLLPS